MASAVRSVDILAMCLIFSGYKPDVTMADVIDRAEAFQRDKNCCFGASSEDFGNAFFSLMHQTGLISLSEYEAFPDRLKQTTLREMISPILGFRELYCNDEGEVWLENNSHDGGDAGCDNPADQEYESRIREFFKDPGSLSHESVSAFYGKHVDEERVLSACFR